MGRLPPYLGEEDWEGGGGCGDSLLLHPDGGGAGEGLQTQTELVNI